MSTSTPWLQRLAATPRAEREAVLSALVVTEFKRWLSMADTEDLPLRESYFDLGVTSLGTVEIKERLEGVLGRRFDSTALFNNPTVEHLIEYLRIEVLADFFDGAATAATDGAPAPANRRDMVNALLDDLYKT